MAQIISITDAQRQQDTAEIIIMCRADWDTHWKIFQKWKDRPHSYTIDISCSDPEQIPALLQQARTAWQNGCRCKE